MAPIKKNTIIVIVGPTASGKSEYAVKLAKKVNGEIISADSRQVYKELNIGSGKITKPEMREVKHYGLDLVSVKRKTPFTVAEYKNYTDKIISSIYQTNKIPILVGGTGFYIRAVVEGLVLPQVPPNQKLRRKLERLSGEVLFEMLKKKDSERAKTIERKNKRRLIRALEIIAALGKVPALKTAKKYDAKFIGIKRAPEELKKRIMKRTKKMLGRGLISETKKLRALGLSWKRIYEFGFEYKYPALFLQKKISRAGMIDSINKECFDYSRRQILWWKKEKRIRWTRPLLA